MKRALLLLGFAALTSAGARAEKLDKEACDGLRGERSRLVAAGTRRDMERGPEWARANLGRDRLDQIAKLMSVEEQLIFRCAALHPQPAAHDEAAPAPKARSRQAKAPDADTPVEAKPKKKKAPSTEAKAGETGDAPKPAKKKVPVEADGAKAAATQADGGDAAQKPRKTARKTKPDDAAAPTAKGETGPQP